MNAIAPGPIWTPLIQQSYPKEKVSFPKFFVLSTVSSLIVHKLNKHSITVIYGSTASCMLPSVDTAYFAKPCMHEIY